jgi:hypothetical protein
MPSQPRLDITPFCKNVIVQEIGGTDIILKDQAREGFFRIRTKG